MSNIKIKVPNILPEGYVKEYMPPKKNVNNFSQWFPQVENCGIRVPKSMFFNVPAEIQRLFYMDEDGAVEKIDAWLHENVVPKMAGARKYFLKNGAFSNKFDFKHCITGKLMLLADIIEINYTSLMYETGGIDEIVLREVIPTDERITPCIYNGMPLRNEFRVFYDFDKREMLYSVNYWDYDYCRPHLKARADAIIFDAMRTEMEAVYRAKHVEVESLVAESMRDVDMQGRWSIDVLLDELGVYWLIDMAVAEKSAYWREEDI